jgi:signal transduction histidine kinase
MIVSDYVAPPVPARGSGKTTLDDIIATHELLNRPSRAPDFEAENAALTALIEAMAQTPDIVLQKLADTALRLCQAGAAGVSIAEGNGRDDVFRWRATAGNYAPYLGGTMPRHFSPCGVVLERNAPILMIGMERYYDYVSSLNAPPHEALLVPFQSDGVTVGTLWVVAHDDTRRFDGEDLRILQSLTHFAAMAVQTLARNQALESANAAASDIRARLLEADRRKDEFLATLAHELRNPLAPLTNALSVVSRSEHRPDLRRQAYATMDRQLRQMVRLVDDLIDISRITRGTIELRQERVLFAEVIQSAIETAQPMIDDAKHTFVAALPDHDVHLDADFTRLAQVFANLINNAAKYTPPGGAIRLMAEADDAELRVTLRDTGIGIAPDKLPHVFDMFNQVDSSMERSHGGLGVGLTLVKNLVELHGGTVTAQSQGLGHGSTFTVRLPVAPEHAAAAAVEGGTAPAARPLRVLVVDDNVASAQTLGWMLEMLGHDIRMVHDGRDVMAAADDFGPDAILLDIGLPGMNGYDVCRSLRAQPRFAAVRLIAQTGWGQDKDLRDARTAGFDVHLVKPVAIEALEAALGK